MQLGSSHFSLLVLTLSIQGLPIAGQLLAALLVGPATLGEIRWLESVFSILLLATSCGMPSLVFRQSALTIRNAPSLSFALVALALTILVSVVVLLFGGLLAVADLFPVIPVSHLMLFLMAAAIVPGNAIRILIAHCQGAEVTQRIFIQVFVFSMAAILIIVGATFLFESNGWVAMRLLLELTLAVLIFRLMHQLTSSTSGLKIPEFRVLAEIGRKGLGANFAFLMRALADNFPILILYKLVSVRDEAGFYSLATLFVFGPILLLSTAMQAELPKLIQTVGDRSAFEKCCNNVGRKLCGITVVGMFALVMMGLMLNINHYANQYRGSAIPLILLAAALPARAFLLLAGSAAVARGWFAISSLISLAEILFVTGVISSGYVGDASSMAIGVVVATWCAVFPGYYLLRATKCVAYVETRHPN